MRAVSHEEWPDIWVPGAETALWTAVIDQAIADSTSRTMTDEAQQDHAEAREWLVGGGPDLEFVCTAAGLDPAAAQAGFIKLAARGWLRPKSARVRVSSFDDHEELENA
jgi:hypothetical protein